MGKSTCADWLQQWGAPVVDTDKLAHGLTQPGSPALAEISAAFGASFLDPAGRLNRSALAELVFADPSARQRLEAILHPQIAAAWAAQVAQWRAAGASLGVVVIPLLFETGAETAFDRIVCVACSRATQASRLAARGWSPMETNRRIAAQLPVEQKMDRADYVLWTEGGVEVLGEQARRVFPFPE
jgi:dephospho-CoA kinase